MIGLWNVIRCMKGATKSRSYSSLIYTILLLFYVASLSVQSTPSAPKPVNKNIVTTVTECRKYLCKYGYLDKCKCHIQLKRHKRSVIDEVLLPTEFESENSADESQEGTTDIFDLSDDDTTLTGLCNDSDFTAAIKRFQQNYRLSVSGICDNRTRAQMSQRRCGQPDSDIVPPASAPANIENTDIEKISRQTRSLREVLAIPNQYNRKTNIRKRQLQSFLEDIKREELTPRKLQAFAEQKHKRSVIHVSTNDDYGGILSQSKITWRLMIAHHSRDRPANRALQRSILRQAFNYWSEVLPLCFEEKEGSPIADIEIGFLEGVHLTCFRHFDGSGGEIAHKYYRDVHFDNSERYYMNEGGSDVDYFVVQNSDVRNESVSLLLAATHELGHVIGLNHSMSENSVMNPIYHTKLNDSFELSQTDLAAALSAYGPCRGSFDEVFDYVRFENGARVYNTFFFRKSIYWRYENKLGRPRVGDPNSVASWNIKGNYGSQDFIKQDIDAFMHYFDVRFNPVRDEYYFFRGDRYFQYNPLGTDLSDSILESGRISSKFPTGSMSLPNYPDAVFFDYRDKITYFFKGAYVYLYNYTTDTSDSCCVNKVLITSLFPPKSNSEISPEGNFYSSNIDSVYYSWYHRSLFFIKGEDVWKNINYNLVGVPQDNSMAYVGKWYDTWHFICDVNCER